MDALRQYVISVVAGAMICGIAMSLFSKGALRQILKMLCGLILSLCVLRPMMKGEIWDSFRFEDFLSDEAAQTAAMGEEYSDRAIREIIKSETEAYILDKAQSLGAKVSAEVSLSLDGVPVAVRIGGSLSPYIKRELSDYISRDLGISKENQVWTT